MNINSSLIKVLHKARLLRYFNLTTTKVIGGKKNTIPLLGKSGYAHLTYGETWMHTVLKKLQPFLSDNGGFVDVGMNVGQTMLAFKAQYPLNPYLGFEPNPLCNFYLQQLVALNRFNDVQLFPVGLSDHEGILDLLFFTHDQADQTASVVEQFRDQSIISKSAIFVTRADRLAVWETTRPAIIKIDVEGGELEVLKGFYDVVKKYRPYIICEILPSYSPENTMRLKRQQQIENLLSQLNYGIAQISMEGDFNYLREIGINTDVLLSNYLFFPLEYESQNERLVNKYRLSSEKRP